MKRVIYGLIILLAVLHQDFWWWDDSETLIFDFLPIGLAYHAGVSVAAAVLWALAVKYCWPGNVDSAGDSVACSRLPEHGLPEGESTWPRERGHATRGGLQDDGGPA